MLIDDRAWLSSILSFPRPDVFAAEGAVQLLFYVRRYCAKLLYELEFHAGDGRFVAEGAVPLRGLIKGETGALTGRIAWRAERFRATSRPVRRAGSSS